MNRQWLHLRNFLSVAGWSAGVSPAGSAASRRRMGGLRKCRVIREIGAFAGSAARTQPGQPARTPALRCVLKLRVGYGSYAVCWMFSDAEGETLRAVGVVSVLVRLGMP